MMWRKTKQGTRPRPEDTLQKKKGGIKNV